MAALTTEEQLSKNLLILQRKTTPRIMSMFPYRHLSQHQLNQYYQHLLHSTLHNQRRLLRLLHLISYKSASVLTRLLNLIIVHIN